MICGRRHDAACADVSKPDAREAACAMATASCARSTASHAASGTFIQTKPRSCDGFSERSSPALVQGTIIAAVAAFIRSNPTGGADGSTLPLAFPVVVGSVLAYVFTLRFFVRALLCYINLARWNTLQSAILEWKVWPKNPKTGTTIAAEDVRSDAVRRKIQDYHKSERDRKEKHELLVHQPAYVLLTAERIHAARH
jgi:hypothetical protein